MPISFCSTCWDGDRQERVSVTRVSSFARILARVLFVGAEVGVKGESFTVSPLRSTSRGETEIADEMPMLLPRWPGVVAVARPKVLTRKHLTTDERTSAPPGYFLIRDRTKFKVHI